MANEQNLKPVRSKKEARERGKKGGVASGEARRQKRDRREWAKIIGALPMKVVCPDGSALEGADADSGVIMNLYRKATSDKAKDGVAAAKVLLTLQGDLEQRVAVTGDNFTIVVNTEEERRKLEQIADLGI